MFGHYNVLPDKTWIETSKTVSRKSPSIFIRYLSQVFIKVMAQLIHQSALEFSMFSLHYCLQKHYLNPITKNQKLGNYYRVPSWNSHYIIVPNIHSHHLPQETRSHVFGRCTSHLGKSCFLALLVLGMADAGLLANEIVRYVQCTHLPVRTGEPIFFIFTF